MISFGAIIALVVVLFIANAASVIREKSAKADAQTAIDMQGTIERLRMQMMENRVALSGYVLTGGPSTLAKFNSGMDLFDRLLADARTKAYSDGQRNALKDLENRNRNWK